jgi:cytochrome b pre-mRNA-processing protein 3
MLNVFVTSKQRRDAAERLYAAVVRRAREPVFFARFAVPDTFDGRFDLLTLHAWLVLGRLGSNDPLAQALVNRIFAGFDDALREMGAGDIGLGRRMKALADAFYGRLKAYDEAASGEALQAALVRNLYRGIETPAAAAIATYIDRARTHLAVAEELDFGPLPGEE